MSNKRQRDEEEDSDEDDDDYDPDKDEDEKAAKLEDLAAGAAVSNSEAVINSIHDIKRHKRVDDIWETMKLEEKNEVKKDTVARKRSLKKANKRGANLRTKQILAGIFGRSTAKEICLKADTTSMKSKNGLKKNKKTSTTTAAVTKTIIRDKIVTETAKYAGQVVEIKRKVGAGSSGMNALDKSAHTSLDSALSAITGPTKLNTVTKSSMDWENYKDETGLGDDLEQAAKNGFLSKKEFLERCDVRRFEKELETRQETKKK